MYKNETVRPDTVNYRQTSDYVISGGKLLHHGGVGIARLRQLFEGRPGDLMCCWWLLRKHGSQFAGTQGTLVWRRFHGIFAVYFRFDGRVRLWPVSWRPAVAFMASSVGSLRQTASRVTDGTRSWHDGLLEV